MLDAFTTQTTSWLSKIPTRNNTSEQRRERNRRTTNWAWNRIFVLYQNPKASRESSNRRYTDETQEEGSACFCFPIGSGKSTKPMQRANFLNSVSDQGKTEGRASFLVFFFIRIGRNGKGIGINIEPHVPRTVNHKKNGQDLLNCLKKKP